MRSLAIAVLVLTTLTLSAPLPSREGPAAALGGGLGSAASGGVRPSGPCALAGRTDSVSESARTPAGYARSYGTVRAVTFLVDFPDAPARISPRERYAEFFPAVADYFRTASYGRLDYRSTPVLRWIRMSRPYAAYGITRGAPFEATGGGGYRAISAEILAAVGRRIALRRYDLVNVLITPNAGPPAVQDVRSVTFAGGPTGVTTHDGAPFENVSFIWSRQTGDSPYRVLNHENGHAFGLPDLYSAHPVRGRTPVGHWDPMDEDWGPANDFLAWHKWKLGWLAPGQVRCLSSPGTRVVALTPTSVPGGPKLAVVPLSRTRAVTLEARAPGPVDHAVCRPGVLVTTLATDTPSGADPVHTVDATPGSAGCYRGDLNVNAGLSDATFVQGQRTTVAGVRIEVLGGSPKRGWRVEVRVPRR
ncbi:M6 family metalloprotease domain-containing protein [Streptomyces sp. UNOC14_S4]|uniref:M6 family metalloprotease domain-containing protein n=1 Tax=Streptomyces sp. UNOC14_S4 TaxID=2872340 RepID=UPI001E4AED68|nr:M6 family metalloprotease domain-containing protein [Streptomyces sp. UNOC14_S4]MCC3766898.1 M6 family metalloprotease domain-containing protein [Streptomyces sp. UNOC14_S4]